MSVELVWTKPVSNLIKGLNKYRKKINMYGRGGADEKARILTGLTLLNFSANGSPNESTVPPIKDGILRGSGSVFTGTTFVGDSKGVTKGTPNKSYNGKPSQITIGYNTSYAARMHETSWTPGAQSKAAGNVGNKWIEKHLKKDGKTLLALYAKKFKDLTGG